MKHQNTKHKTLAISTLLSSTIFATGTQADDVEIYVTPPSDPVAPNVLFVLDESGSMGSRDACLTVNSSGACTSWGSRMQALKNAMVSVLSDTNNDNINAGMLAYTTRTHPTRVLYKFELIKNKRSAMISAINDRNFRPRGGTPTIHALSAAVQWYDAGFRGESSPIGQNASGNWCKPNYIVFLSDGAPNSNIYENDIGNTLRVNNRNPDTYRSTNCANPANGTPFNNPYDGNAGWGGGGQWGQGGGSCAGEIGRWALNADLRTGGKWDWDPNDPNPTQSNKRVQNIVIHTIGMAMGLSANPTGRELFMRYVAQEGGGQYFPATNAADLTAAFQQILNAAKASIPYTYTAPTIPFDRNNAAISGSDIYVPVFTPGVHGLWYGNIKKYAFSYEPSVPSDPNSRKIVVIRDTNGDLVVDTSFQFKASVDKWNATGQLDGYDPAPAPPPNDPTKGDPLKGGAASNMAVATGASRNLYTWLGGTTNLADASNRIEKTNNTLDAGILGNLTANTDLDDLGNSFQDRKNGLLDWLTWAADLTLPDGNGGTVTVSHRNEMGASLHSQPVVVRKGGNEIVFITTTEGILHALDASTGKEIWAFMPSDLLDTIAQSFVNDWNASKPHDRYTGEPIPPNDHGHVLLPQYGLDGPLLTYEHKGKTYLLMGMRRGGRNYYALDISDPLQPEFAWKIEGGTGDFSDLGQTWSKPIFTRVELNGGSAEEVLIFGGGYDPRADESYIDNNSNGVFDAGDTRLNRNQDSSGNTVSDWLGNVIYIVDPETGARIRKFDDSDMVQGDMENPIASDLLPVDINANGITDRLYAAGVGGRIIRVDIPDKALAAFTGNSQPSATVVADVNLNSSGNLQAADDYQRFFNTPEVAYYNKGGIQYLALMISSGHRPDLLSTSVNNDRFYMMMDPNVWTAPPDSNGDGNPDYPTEIHEGNLYNATSNDIQAGNASQQAAAQLALNSAKGWYINLASGEKGLSAAKVYDYAVTFTTYSGTRSPSTDACDALNTQGEARVYALDMTNGGAIIADMDGTTGLSTADRSKRLNIPGIPPSPDLVFPKTTDAQGNVKLGGEVLLMVGLEEVTRWPDRFHPISWEEVIDD